jgi:hypothetical protein
MKLAFGMGFVSLIVSFVMLQIPGVVIAAEEVEMNRESSVVGAEESEINIDTSALEGKVLKYRYHGAVLVEARPGYERLHSLQPPGIVSSVPYVIMELRFGHLACTWTGLEVDPSMLAEKGKVFDTPKMSKTATQPCIQIEIEPDIYQTTWMEPNGDNITMIINLKTKKVYTSYRFEPGPVLELLVADIVDFGPAYEMGY